MKIGYLYIVTNEAFPEWVKVGTTFNLKERLHVYQTCDPFRRYKLVYSLHHPEFRNAEKNIKETMKHFGCKVLQLTQSPFQLLKINITVTVSLTIQILVRQQPTSGLCCSGYQIIPT